MCIFFEIWTITICCPYFKENVSFPSACPSWILCNSLPIVLHQYSTDCNYRVFYTYWRSCQTWGQTLAKRQAVSMKLKIDPFSIPQHCKSPYLPFSIMQQHQPTANLQPRHYPPAKLLKLWLTLTRNELRYGDALVRPAAAASAISAMYMSQMSTQEVTLWAIPDSVADLWYKVDPTVKRLSSYSLSGVAPKLKLVWLWDLFTFFSSNSTSSCNHRNKLKKKDDVVMEFFPYLHTFFCHYVDHCYLFITSTTVHWMVQIRSLYCHSGTHQLKSLAYGVYTWVTMERKEAFCIDSLVNCVCCDKLDKGRSPNTWVSYTRHWPYCPAGGTAYLWRTHAAAGVLFCEGILPSVFCVVQHVHGSTCHCSAEKISQ